ncbi:MAG TPA: hypothetical protein VFS00_07540, partial [Polyangiaceae bacterium]|nr:hypothetical protein [Polyangiaceae bacterium]
MNHSDFIEPTPSLDRAPGPSVDGRGGAAFAPRAGGEAGTSPTAARPVGAEERLDVLDAVRGFALGGVLLANLVSFAGY